jgi:hypothetical protein
LIIVRGIKRETVPTVLQPDVQHGFAENNKQQPSVISVLDHQQSNYGSKSEN